jgi:hypothetical protein
MHNVFAFHSVRVVTIDGLAIFLYLLIYLLAELSPS